MTDFAVNLCGLIQQLLLGDRSGWVQPVELIPLFGDVTFVQGRIQTLRDATQVLQRVNLSIAQETRVARQSLLLNRMVNHDFAFELREFGEEGRFVVQRCRLSQLGDRRCEPRWCHRILQPLESCRHFLRHA